MDSIDPQSRGDSAREDISLMLRAKEGDLEAFESLVGKYQRSLMNFFARLGVYNGDVEDLAQETFLRLYKYRSRYRPAAKFTTFLFLMARQVRIDSLRKAERLAALHEKAARESPEYVVPTSAESGGALDAERALSMLSPPMREVVVLAVMEGLSREEVANIQGVPVGTVKSRLSIALQKMREFMERGGPTGK